MHRIRDELEDLSFEVLNEDARKLIKDRLDKIKENNLINFNNISDQFSEILKDKYDPKIVGRENAFSNLEKNSKKRTSLNK